MTDELVLVRRAAVALEPVMDIETAKSRMQKLQEFCAHYLQESSDGGNDGGDYGIIPGAGKKKVLLKSGADKLCDVYGLADTYTVLSKAENWETGLFEYTLECRLQSKVDDSLVGSGLGSCSSFESKYRWRASARKCPTCAKADTIIKGKEEYGGGWVCFKKKGGCGAKFKDGDRAIESQEVGRVDNPDIIDTRNTVLKMAKKRAKIDAVICVTRSSGIFTQDLEDIEQPQPAPKPESGSKPEQSATTTSGVVENYFEGVCKLTEQRTKGTATFYETTVGDTVFATGDISLADRAVTLEHQHVGVTWKPTPKGAKQMIGIEPIAAPTLTMESEWSEPAAK
jgi:hypothetical protein